MRHIATGADVEGTCSVSAPIFGPDGNLIAGLNLGAPSSRYAQGRKRLIQIVRAQAARITDALRSPTRSSATAYAESPGGTDMMQLARIVGADGKPVAAAWIDGKVVELPVSSDPAFADLSTLLSGGDAALARAESYANQALAAGKGRDATRVEFLAPTTPSVFLGLGYNYKALATNEGVPFNKHPELFAKMPGSAVGHDHPVRVPRVIDKVDFEAELGVVIGRTARRVKAKDALGYVGGYTACNDLTAKIIPRPKESGSIVVPLKAVDTFGPLGPTLIPAQGIDPQNFTLLCRVNGVERQRFSTNDMVHSVAEVIEFITARITLNPGDVITTGTSLGIGIIQKPPVFLQEGDVMEVQIEGFPALRNTIEWEKE